MIEVKGLTKRYGQHEAAREITFSVAKGEVVGFLGPNGAGKTTTMNMITGYLSPTEGTASVGGHGEADLLRGHVRAESLRESLDLDHALTSPIVP